MTTSAPKIVTIGDLTVDLVMPVKLPIEPGTSQQVAWHRVEPGATGNFLIAGQRIGAQMIALGAVGDDMYGHYVLKVLRDEGIDVAGVAAVPGLMTTAVLVLFEPDTGKFSYAWYGDQARPLPVSDTAARLIEQADALFMQGYTLCEAALRPLSECALTSGKPVWLDVGPEARLLNAEDRTLLREHAYAIIATEQEVPLITEGETGAEAYDLLLGAGAKLVIIKRGSEGCRIINREGQTDVPAFPVTVRDLVGAGDCFNAAFIYASLRGLPPAEAARLANAAGGAKIQKLGTGRSMPTRQEIEAVLRASGVNFDT